MKKTLVVWLLVSACAAVVRAESLQRRFDAPASPAGLRLEADDRPDVTQNASPDPEEIAPHVEASTATVPRKKNEWLIAPLPFHQPTIGWGIQGALGYLYHPFKDEPQSRPWMTGVNGLYSSNGSWMGALFHKMNLDHDRWRSSMIGLKGRFNYDYFGVGTDAGNAGVSVPINQDMGMAAGQLLRQIVPKWYAGGGYAFLHVRANVEGGNAGLPPSLQVPAPALDSNVALLSAQLQHDSRDNEYFPRRGGYSKLSVAMSNEAWASDFRYTNFKIESNRYIAMAGTHVLAMRASAQWADSGAPFFALPSFGAKNDLRGYIGGQYRDRLLWATQGEYRLPLWRALGGVAFAGVGEVAPSVSQVSVSNLLPAGGVGLRYTIATQNHVNLRFDYAWGKATQTFYFGIGEAF